MKQEIVDALCELYVVSFSQEQGHPHVDSIEEHLKNNSRAIRSGRPLSYFPIIFTDNRETADKICQKILVESRKKKYRDKPNWYSIKQVIDTLDVFGNKKAKEAQL